MDVPGASAHFYNKSYKTKVRMLENKTKILYILSFLGGMQGNIVASLFVVFGLSLGFSIAYVGLLLGASRLSQFIFEIPTGIFADTYGRKKSILLCYFFSLFFYLIYFFGSDFYLLLLGSVIGGFALSFMSGAFEALAVDSLALSDKEQFRNKVFVRLTVITTLGFIAGGLVGSAIAYFDLRYIWLFQAAAAIFALILGWRFLKEKFFPREATDKKENVVKILIRKIKEPAAAILRDKKIPTMFAVSILISSASAFYLVSWPIIFKEILTIPVYYFGLISSAAGLFYLIGSFLAEKFSLTRGAFNTVLFSLILMGLFYFIFGLSKSLVFSLLSFIAIDFFNGGFSPLFYSFLNGIIPSSRRATILSFYSLVEGGSSGLGEMMAGKLIIIFGAPMVIFFPPLLIFIALFSFSRAKKT